MENIKQKPTNKIPLNPMEDILNLNREGVENLLNEPLHQNFKETEKVKLPRQANFEPVVQINPRQT